MSLFKKKCTYCRKKIDKGSEVKRDVKLPEFHGTHSKNFCSKKHADLFEKEIEEKMKCKTGGSCCG